MEEENKTNATVGGENPTTGAEQNKQGDNKTLSFDELINNNKDYQSAYDKKVREAIETAKANWEEIINDEKSEAEKLAKMNETQKLQYQLQKEKKEKEEALAESNAFKLKEQAIKVASEKGLDVSLLNYFDFKTIKAEELNVKIDEVANAFNKAVERKVNEKLREDTPVTKIATTIDNKKISRASY